MLEADDEDGARDPYYIRTSAATSDIPRLVVKCEDAFFVADHHGDFPELPASCAAPPAQTSRSATRPPNSGCQAGARRGGRMSPTRIARPLLPMRRADPVRDRRVAEGRRAGGLLEPGPSEPLRPAAAHQLNIGPTIPAIPG
jgi:hypothetical protein